MTYNHTAGPGEAVALYGFYRSGSCFPIHCDRGPVLNKELLWFGEFSLEY